MESEVWSEFTRDPRDAQFRALRASDQDRAVVLQVLSEAYAEGRIDRDEFDERSDAARTVRTLGDIDPLLQDLVAPPPERGQSLVQASPRDLERLAHEQWMHKRREAVFSFLGASLITTAIWFATCWGKDGFEFYFFWPGFVIVISLLHLLRTASSRDQIVEEEVRRLQRRQAKQLRSRQPRRRTDGHG